MAEDSGKVASVDRLAEVNTIGKVADALSELDAEAVARVIRWAVDAYGVSLGSGTGRNPGAGSGNSRGTGAASSGNGSDAVQFASLADLYAATNPESDADKALVAGYWTQFGDGKAEFGSQEINGALKNLGHAIGNITSAFDNLKARRPAPVMQVKKAGTTKQARKTYKLTLAGKSAVEAMVSQN